MLQQPSRHEPPEEVAAEQPLRQWRLARADGEVDAVRGGELLGDLEAGVAAADDENRPCGTSAGLR